MIKTKKELIDHCLNKLKRLNQYTFEHYVLMELLNNVSDEEFECISNNFKCLYLNE